MSADLRGGVGRPQPYSPHTWEPMRTVSDPPWYSRKPYIHFDLPLSKQRVVEYVTNPQKITRHSFYPLLGYDLTRQRIRRCPPDSLRPFTKDPKVRPIAYPAHMDGSIFSYYKSLLETPYEDWLLENGLGDSVTAFRSVGENNLTLSLKAIDFIAAQPDCQIVVTDIESFFGNLDHKILKKVWARFLGVSSLPDDHYAVYKAVTKYSVLPLYKVYNLFGIRISGRLSGPTTPERICTPREFREKVVPRGLLVSHRQAGAGIPQGTSLSPLLSNMYMADLDLAMSTWVASLGGKYWRYCDDILIVVPGNQNVPILDRIDQELCQLKLKRSIEKTEKLDGRSLSHRKQLQYLGLVFDGNNVRIRSSSIQRSHRKLKKAIWATRKRRDLESEASGSEAPFRRRALYNMHSELPVHGKRIHERLRKRKHKGNFTHYMEKAAKTTGFQSISSQRQKLLKRVYNRINQEAG